MHFLELIRAWPQFIQHVIINDIAPFNELIVLTQTCTELRNYYHTMLKTYIILCNYHRRRINISIFFDINNFYQNLMEKQLFRKIYAFQKNKPSIDDASTYNLVVVLEWHLSSGLKSKYSKKAINNASKFGNIDILNLWIKYAKSDNIKLRYNENAIDFAFTNGYINILNWWRDQAVYGTLEFKMRNPIIDNAIGDKSVLFWCFDNYNFLKNHNIILEYSERIVDLAAKNGKVDILDHWIKFININKLEFKYTNNAINDASCYGRVDVLNWFLVSGLELKFDKEYIEYLIKLDHNISTWWINSGLLDTE